jgi:predicted nucleotidyltransferase
MDVDAWMEALVRELCCTFGPRLKFVGLQGSFARGEATESSDIDVVVVFDKLEVSDLTAYREILSTMPNEEIACGFVSGLSELAAWPRHELFCLSSDTRPWYGDLGRLIPEPTLDDALYSVHQGASGIYHLACHTLLHCSGSQIDGRLKELLKSSFFVLRSLVFIRTGSAVLSACDTASHLDGKEREIMDAFDRSRRSRSFSDSEHQRMLGILVEWSSDALRQSQCGCS